MCDIEDDSMLDQQNAALITDVGTPNILGHNLFKRLGLAQSSEAEATGSSSNNNLCRYHNLSCFSKLCCTI